MASKAPKSRCYSMTASADFRFVCSVGQKTLGETYTQEIAEKIHLLPGKHHLRYIAKTDKLLLQRRAITNMKEFKKHRNENKKARSALRHLRENSEGVTYGSNCGLLIQSDVPDEKENQEIEADDGIDSFILFDLKTSSLRRDCDILQIAAVCGQDSFDIYINPRQPIAPSASAVTGLMNCNGTLLLHGKFVQSVALKVALEKFLEWIENLGKSILIAHNLGFDGPRLYDSIKKYNLEDKFSTVVHGFLDTLPLIRSITGKKGKGECSPGGLAKCLNVVGIGDHNAIIDCKILSRILYALKISNTMLLNNVKIYNEKVDEWNHQDQNDVYLTQLQPLENVLGVATRTKLPAAAITLTDLNNVHSMLGGDGVINLFKENIKNKSMAPIQAR
ncbi:uncharacterized protein LOC107042147 [Diachasma alloeum]|uniref:uncharacterized protein LOC107042147 n=1 Tax=Diachasma alloeum TaxID=454923 RepID=UPI00073816E0|nr:uncharacterized protein LOC107042147 [Diachasma alloeum]